MVIVRGEAERVEGSEGRVDPGHRRQGTAGGVLEEACCVRVDPEFKLGLPAQAGLAEIAEVVVVSCGVAGVSKAQRRGVKAVPAPGNIVVVQVPDERGFVVDGWQMGRQVIPAAGGAPAQGVQAVGPGRARDRAEPAVTDQELPRQVVVYGHVRAVVVPHSG